MRPHLIWITLGASLAAAPALAQENCPWAGGAYKFSDHGIYGDFVVDETCSQMVWDRLADGPETSALVAVEGGWTGELKTATFKLLDDGSHVTFKNRGGGAQQRSKVLRKN